MDLKQRKIIRLQNYDYATCGAYFITICTHDRKHLLSSIRRDDPCGRPYAVPTDLGLIAIDVLHSIEDRYDVAVIDYVVMPDHVHMVMFLPERNDSQEKIPLGRIIGAYKSIVSTRWLSVCKSQGVSMAKIWQAGYYDHVVRNDTDLKEIREYIQWNPDRWYEKYKHLCGRPQGSSLRDFNEKQTDL